MVATGDSFRAPFLGLKSHSRNAPQARRRTGARAEHAESDLPSFDRNGAVAQLS